MHCHRNRHCTLPAVPISSTETAGISNVYQKSRLIGLRGCGGEPDVGEDSGPTGSNENRRAHTLPGPTSKNPKWMVGASGRTSKTICRSGQPTLPRIAPSFSRFIILSKRREVPGDLSTRIQSVPAPAPSLRRLALNRISLARNSPAGMLGITVAKCCSLATAAESPGLLLSMRATPGTRGSSPARYSAGMPGPVTAQPLGRGDRRGACFVAVMMADSVSQSAQPNWRATS